MEISEASGDLVEVVSRARHGHPTVLADQTGDAAVVISAETYAELQRLRAAEQHRIVTERIAEIDAGAPLRTFASAEEMVRAADADRAVRGAA